MVDVIRPTAVNSVAYCWMFRAYLKIRRAPIVPQIFRQIRRFSAGELSPGKGNRRDMAEKTRCKRCADNFGIGS